MRLYMIQRFLLSIVLIARIALSQTPPNSPDIQIFQSNNTQTFVSLGVHPRNSNVLMTSFLSVHPFGHLLAQVWFFSTNSGTSWFGSEEFPPGVNESWGGPVAFFDVSGRAYYVTLGLLGGVYVLTTTDFGGT